MAVILGAGAFWGYRAWSSDTYLYALPSHPKALMAVDWPELVRGTGLEAEELSAGCPEGAGIPQGIDWKKRTYAFVSGREFTGFLAAVEDRDELAEWFRKAAKEKLCSEPEEGGGRCWTVWDGSWMVGFDDRALLVMGFKRIWMPSDGKSCRAFCRTRKNAGCRRLCSGTWKRPEKLVLSRLSWMCFQTCMGRNWLWDCRGIPI